MRLWRCCDLEPARSEDVYCSSTDYGITPQVPPSDYQTVSASSTEDSSMKKTEGEEQSSSVATDTMQATAQKTQKRRDETGQPATDSGPTSPTDEIVAQPEGELLE